MEDYNQVPFRDMVSQKIQKKDSERGATSFGFPIHGGKPIKELYRTVYTGGDDQGYMKEPVTKIHRTVTNEEGVSEKALKSDRSHSKNLDDADIKNAVRNPQSKNRYTTPGYGVDGDVSTGYGVDGDVEEETEHEEKSIRDMIAGKNITGFAKGNGATVNARRGKVVNGLLNETGRAIGDEMDSEDRDEDRLDDLLNREMELDAARLDVQDTDDQMMQNSIDLYNEQGVDVDPEYLRQTPSQNSEPVGHNGSGMGLTRGLMADALNNKEALLNAVKQEDGSEGLVLADDGRTLVNRNPHVSEERLRQDSDPLMR